MSSSHPQDTAMLAIGMADLEPPLEEFEVQRLKESYPKYVSVPYRGVVLKGTINNVPLRKIFEDVMVVLNKQDAPKQSKGGIGRKLQSKSSNVVMRLMYLRCIASGLSRVEANRELLRYFSNLTTETVETAQSRIRRVTQVTPKKSKIAAP